MKSIRIGLVLSAIAVTGFIATSCTKDETKSTAEKQNKTTEAKQTEQKPEAPKVEKKSEAPIAPPPPAIEIKQEDSTIAAPKTAKKAEAPKVTKQSEAPAVAGAPAWIREFFGDKLTQADGKEVSPDKLAGKTIGIYFSAHWCPPCRQFTPMLVKTYNELQKAGKPFDIVFISSDQGAEQMRNYMTEAKMPWKALPFGDRHKLVLGHKYQVRGIPTLVIVDKDGKTITTSGRVNVMQKGAAAFDDWTK